VRRARLPRLGDPALLIPLVGAALLIYLAVMPLVMLFWGSFQDEVAPREYVFTIQNYIDAYASPHTYSTFRNSLGFAIGAALLAFSIGTVLAWLVERTNTPFRTAFLPLSLVPLIIPGVLEAISWILLLSPKIGYINVFLMNLLGLESAPINVFSLAGMIWVQAVGQAPLAFLLMCGARYDASRCPCCCRRSARRCSSCSCVRSRRSRCRRSSASPRGSTSTPARSGSRLPSSRRTTGAVRRWRWAC
jgi:ABC-type Fe3+ transport system permease subunit